MTYVLGNMMFIHITKTGGHAVWTIFEAHGGVRLKDFYGFGNGYPLHHTAAGLMAKFGDEYEKYEKFSLVRNPWERAVSLYFGQDNVETHSRHAFKKWMLASRKGLNVRYSPWVSQTRFLAPEVKVFDLSRIEELYEWIEGHGYAVADPGVIPTGKNKDIRRPPYREYFNDSFKHQISKMHADDIERFGWVF